MFATLPPRASLTALPAAPTTAPNGTNVSASSAADFAKPAPSPSYSSFGRSRNADHSAPPAQIPACGITALGSYFEYLAQNLISGYG
ncbi:MAG: hypothetical protein P8X74_23740, partial [Reinekea sp.]